MAELGTGELGKDGKYHLLTKLAGGFVTRGGKKWAFPDVDFTFTPFSENAFTVSKIDLTAVAADVTRVSVEALGDSIAQLPGTKESTGCKSLPPSARLLRSGQLQRDRGAFRVGQR